MDGYTGDYDNYKVETLPALCVTEELEDQEVDIWCIKAIRFDTDEVNGRESKRAWRAGQLFIPTLAHKRRCIATLAKARQMAIDLAPVVDYYEGNTNRRRCSAKWFG